VSWNAKSSVSGRTGVLVEVGVAVIDGVGEMLGVTVAFGVRVIVGVGERVLVGVMEGVGGKTTYAAERPKARTTTAAIPNTAPPNSSRQPLAACSRRSR
jgi:hypothetical protein